MPPSHGFHLYISLFQPHNYLNVDLGFSLQLLQDIQARVKTERLRTGLVTGFTLSSTHVATSYGFIKDFAGNPIRVSESDTFVRFGKHRNCAVIIIIIIIKTGTRRKMKNGD